MPSFCRMLARPVAGLVLTHIMGLLQRRVDISAVYDG